jgi:uncharacterized protein (TIGR00369 family)
MDRDEAEALLGSCELHALIGLELAEWEPGRVSLRFAPPSATRPGGSGPVHGGALATALDTAATLAIISSIGADASTVDLRLDYVRPALDEVFGVEGRTTRAGRRVGFADAELRTASGRLVASARGTFVW